MKGRDVRRREEEGEEEAYLEFNPSPAIILFYRSKHVLVFSLFCGLINELSNGLIQNGCGTSPLNYNNNDKNQKKEEKEEKERHANENRQNGWTWKKKKKKIGGVLRFRFQTSLSFVPVANPRRCIITMEEDA